MPLLVLARIVLEAGHLLQANWRRCVALAAAPVAVSLVFELAGEFGSSDTGMPTAADVGIAVGARLLSTLALVPFMCLVPSWIGVRASRSTRRIPA